MTRKFWINIALIGLFLFVTIAATFAWLKRYTKHNQRLELPDYIGMTYDEALEDADDHDFRIVILDSIHVVGREGNIILQQNPVPGAFVKENRTIYVTVTKRSADRIAMSRIPVLYGKKYSIKKRELLESFQIQSEVVGERFDPGEPGYILAVIYEGDTISDYRGRNNDVLIDKGGKLKFIISKDTGGQLPIPDLVCLTYAEARFLLSNSGLGVGEVITDGVTGIVDSAYVTGQVPDPAEGSITMGEKIKLSLSQNKPISCR